MKTLKKILYGGLILSSLGFYGCSYDSEKREYNSNSNSSAPIERVDSHKHIKKNNEKELRQLISNINSQIKENSDLMYEGVDSYYDNVGLIGKLKNNLETKVSVDKKNMIVGIDPHNIYLRAEGDSNNVHLGKVTYFIDQNIVTGIHFERCSYQTVAAYKVSTDCLDCVLTYCTDKQGGNPLRDSKKLVIINMKYIDTDRSKVNLILRRDIPTYSSKALFGTNVSQIPGNLEVQVLRTDSISGKKGSVDGKYEDLDKRIQQMVVNNYIKFLNSGIDKVVYSDNIILTAWNNNLPDRFNQIIQAKQKARDEILKRNKEYVVGK